jgi:hypothetical protein
MNAEQIGSFRTRPTGDGSLEVWARGWRVPSPLYALIPAGLALMFVVSPMPLPMRGIGAIVMLASGVFVFRLTKPGLLLSTDAVTIVGVVRTRRFEWAGVSGFMGERRHDEGRVLLVLTDESRVPLPGTLDPGELDPYGEEGEVLSAVDQLNRLGEQARSDQLPRATGPVAPVRVAAGPPADKPSGKERRSERKQLKAALKAVRLPKEGREVADTRSEPTRRRGLGRRRHEEPVAEPTQVATSEPEPRSAPAVRKAEPAAGLASYYPKPVYIPQEEYAAMLREQKAAEKAAAAAAQELRELADVEELAEKDEFSDWTQ